MHTEALQKLQAPEEPKQELCNIQSTSTADAALAKQRKIRGEICLAAKLCRFACTHECLSRKFVLKDDANSLSLNQWSISKETDWLSLTTFPSKLNSTCQSFSFNFLLWVWLHVWSTLTLSTSLWEASPPEWLQVTSLGLTLYNSLQMKNMKCTPAHLTWLKYLQLKIS